MYTDTMRFLHRNNYVRDDEHGTQLKNLQQANKSINNYRFKLAFFGCKSQLHSCVLLYMGKKDFEGRMLPMSKPLFSRCVWGPVTVLMTSKHMLSGWLKMYIVKLRRSWGRKRGVIWSPVKCLWILEMVKRFSWVLIAEQQCSWWAESLGKVESPSDLSSFTEFQKHRTSVKILKYYLSRCQQPCFIHAVKPSHSYQAVELKIGKTGTHL